MNFEDFGIFGFDVSFYQDNDYTYQKIDFQKMKEFGASFIIIKVGQDNYNDEDFSDYWRDAKAAGIPRSGYWFCDKDSSGYDQALMFWNSVKNDPPEGMLFADYEDGSWTDWTKLKEFLQALQTLSGYPSERIGIYTAYYFWLDHSPTSTINQSWFKQFPLWLAAYTSNPSNVIVPRPWGECLLWQDGTPPIGYLVGVESKDIDHNKFNGDPIKFKQYMGGVPVTPPPGGNVILYYADLRNGYVSNVRGGAGLSYPVKTQIAGPLTVSIVSEKVTVDGYDWYQIESPTSGWVALTTAYTNLRSAETSQAHPVSAIVTMSDGSTYKADLVKQ